MAQSGQALTTRTVSGASWSALGRAIQHVVSVAGTAVLARLLTPDAYGLLGMAVVLVGFIRIFRDLGTSAAVIQRSEVNDRFLSSVFWVNLLFGLVSCVVCAVTAPWVAAFYRTPALTPVIAVLSVSFVLSSAGIVHNALLQRRMAFKQVATIEAVCAGVGTATAIAMAAAGYGVWSLVASQLVNTACESLLFWCVSDWRPRLVIDVGEMRSIGAYSLHLSGFQIVNYASRNFDNLLVGRYLGPSLLGCYSLAYNLMLYPISNVSSVLGRVLFPAFSQLQHDNERFRRAYVRACMGIATVTFPMMLGLMITGDLVVAVFLGPKWSAAAPLVIMLSPVGLVQSIVTTVGLIYTAKGRTDWLFRWGFVATAAVLAGFALGLRWGVNGVAGAYLIVTMILLYPTFAIPFKLIGLPVRAFFSALAPVFAYSLLALGAGLLARLALAGLGLTQPWIVLTAASLAGAAAYAAGLWRGRPEFFQDVLALVAPHLPARIAGRAARSAATE